MLFYLWNILAENGLDDIASKGAEKKPFLQLSDIVTIALLMVVIFIVMRSTSRRSKASRSKGNSTAKELVNNKLAEKPNVSIRRLQELMAALADMSREISGQIDTRTAKLEILLAKADNQIAEYEKTFEKLRATQALNNLAANKPTISEPPASINISEKIDINIDEIDNGMPEIHSTIAPAIAKQPEPDSSYQTQPANTVNDRIIKLAKDGIPLTEISRATGRPTGEIELILNLNGIKLR